METDQIFCGEIIDVHCHCFVGREAADTVRRGLAMLRREGLRHMVVVALINTKLDAKTMWNLVPDFVENRGDALFHEAADLMELARLNAPVICPLIDTRHLWGDVPSTLRGYLDQGFRGIKGIYLADDGNDLGIGNVPDTFGISLKAYQRREWEIFAFAEANELPLLYHMDARRYGDLMQAMLADFPRLRINFAHFGIGRSALRKILDRYPNVYTDIASMREHIQNSPDSYRDFICDYPDRVCFGSDALLYQPETVLEHIRAVKELALPEVVQQQIFSNNPRRFLGQALTQDW